MDKMKNKRLFLLDMDGTLYLDDRLFPGAAEFLAKIQKRGGQISFFDEQVVERCGCLCGKDDAPGRPGGS